MLRKKLEQDPLLSLSTFNLSAAADLDAAAAEATADLADCLGALADEYAACQHLPHEVLEQTKAILSQHCPLLDRSGIGQKLREQLIVWLKASPAWLGCSVLEAILPQGGLGWRWRSGFLRDQLCRAVLSGDPMHNPHFIKTDHDILRKCVELLCKRYPGFATVCPQALETNVWQLPKKPEVFEPMIKAVFWEPQHSNVRREFRLSGAEDQAIHQWLGVLGIEWVLRKDSSDDLLPPAERHEAIEPEHRAAAAFSILFHVMQSLDLLVALECRPDTRLVSHDDERSTRVHACFGELDALLAAPLVKIANCANEQGREQLTEDARALRRFFKLRQQKLIPVRTSPEATPQWHDVYGSHLSATVHQPVPHHVDGVDSHSIIVRQMISALNGTARAWSNVKFTDEAAVHKVQVEVKQLNTCLRKLLAGHPPISKSDTTGRIIFWHLLGLVSQHTSPVGEKILEGLDLPEHPRLSGPQTGWYDPAVLRQLWAAARKQRLTVIPPYPEHHPAADILPE